MGITDQSGHRFETLIENHLTGGHDQCSGTIIEARRVAGGDAAVFFGGRFHLAQLLGIDLGADMLVRRKRHRTFAGRYFDRHDRRSVNRPSAIARAARCWLSSANSSWSLTSDAIALGDVFRNNAHVETAKTGLAERRARSRWARISPMRAPQRACGRR